MKTSPRFLTVNGARNAVLLGSVAAKFGQSPSDYLDIETPFMRYQVDLACAVACWEDENQKYKEAKEKALEESKERGAALDNYKKSLTNG